MKKMIGFLTALFFLISSNAQDYHPNGVIVGTDEAGASITQKAEFNWGDVVRVYRAGTNVWNLQSRLDLANCPNFTSANLYINNQVALHANNFNSYAPTLIGAGASGNWNINAASATSWGGKYASLTTAQQDAGQTISNILTTGSDGVVRVSYVSNIRDVLGIPSTGETLQSVTDRGNVTKVNLLIDNADASKKGFTFQSPASNWGPQVSGVFFKPKDNTNAAADFSLELWNGAGATQSRLSVDGASGNVGIGTTIPNEKLQVNGNMIVTGAIYWDWTGRAISVVVPPEDADGRVIRFSNSMTNGHGNPYGGFDFTNSYGESTMRIINNNVGIGTTSPAYKLDVNGDVFMNTLRLANVASIAPDGLTNSLSILKDGNLLIPKGYVGIGTNTPQSELAVKGTITSMKVKVTQTGWADYVFDSSYQLASLHQVEKFIQENKHLPEVPSAAEVKKDGLDLGNNQAVLLKKIEELTLYIIQQNKEILQQNKEMAEVKKRLAEIEAGK